MNIRENTDDDEIFHAVYICNEYNLPESMAGQTVLDIGAHIGCFALACLERGARMIFCYEPHSENNNTLKENLLEASFKEPRPGCARFTIENYRVKPEAVDGDTRRFATLTRCPQHGNRSGDTLLLHRGPGEVVEVIPFHEVVTAVIGQKIDLVKLDCEGSEYSILLHSPIEVFAGIQSLAVEFHEPCSRPANAAIERMVSAGFKETYRRMAPDGLFMIWKGERGA